MLAAYPANLPILLLSIIIIWGLIRNVEDRTYCRKTKPLTVNSDFIFFGVGSVRLYIVSAAILLLLSAAVIYILSCISMVSCTDFSSGWSSAWGRAKVTGCPMWWVRQMGNHWNAMLGQEFHHIQGRWAWHIVEVQKAGTPKAICEAVQQTAPPRHSRKVLRIVKVISVGEILDQICFTFFDQGDEGIFQSNVFYWFSAVSPNAWCRISYLLVVVLCSFQQNLMQKHYSFITLISQCDVGKITHCRLLRLWWSQPATCSLVCGVRRCCHFNNVSSLTIKITFCPRYFWSSWIFGEDCYFRKTSLHNWSYLFFTSCRSIFWHHSVHEYSLVLIL